MSEFEQTEKFLAECNYPALKKVLLAHLSTLKAAEVKAAEAASAPAPPVQATPAANPNIVTHKPPAAPSTPSAKFINLDDISWTQGDGFDSPQVTVYVGLPGVGKAKERVEVKFGTYSIDVVVMDLDGKNYRYVQDNLDKDIVPSECKHIVKANKIILKLQKVKGQYSYENWQQLVCKKKRDPNAEKKSKEDPQGGIMDMMNQLYNDGDDNMKKVIGEAMLKSRSGEKLGEPTMPDMAGL